MNLSANYLVFARKLLYQLKLIETKQFLKTCYD
jgi:hypothetical protein